MTTETIEVTGRGPKWVLNMAREYAAAHGMATINIADFFATNEYKAQVSRNLRACDREINADIRANR